MIIFRVLSVKAPFEPLQKLCINPMCYYLLAVGNAHEVSTHRDVGPSLSHTRIRFSASQPMQPSFHGTSAMSPPWTKSRR